MGSKSSSTSTSEAQDRRVAAADEAFVVSGFIEARDGGFLNLDTSRHQTYNTTFTETDQGAVDAGKAVALDAIDLSGRVVESQRLTQAEALAFARDVLAGGAADHAAALSAIGKNVDTVLTFARSAQEGADQEISQRLITAGVIVAVAAAGVYAWRK